MEPLRGHPQELREFIDNTLEAPFEGTPESKAKVTESIMAQFPGIAEQLKKRSEAAASTLNGTDAGGTTEP